MRTYCTLLVLFAVVAFFLASCSKDNKEKNEDDNTSSLTRKWASANCGVQPYGNFYKFGDNPCPSGYRLPTKADLEELLTFPRRWSESNNPGGVMGMWFGPTREAVSNATAVNPNGCVFFPAAGRRRVDSGGNKHDSIRGIGQYWSSSLAGSDEYGDYAWSMYFDSYDNPFLENWDEYGIGGNYGWMEYSVRCIK